jgi:glycosyltransferase involved in cell wall biosynthesis
VDVALIGSWTWAPNAAGLRWFADEVVPQLPEDTTIEVAGPGAERLWGVHPQLTVRGSVPSAADFMARARVIAVPSVIGEGVQVKTLDAVACGAPVVATPTATRGLDGLPESVTVAGEPEAFAAALVRLARTPEAERERLHGAALAWSRARRERLARSVAGFLADLTNAGEAQADAGDPTRRDSLAV